MARDGKCGLGEAAMAQHPILSIPAEGVVPMSIFQTKLNADVLECLLRHARNEFAANPMAWIAPRLVKFYGHTGLAQTDS